MIQLAMIKTNENKLSDTTHHNLTTFVGGKWIEMGLQSAFTVAFCYPNIKWK
jgi:hypothetical protein